MHYSRWKLALRRLSLYLILALVLVCCFTSFSMAEEGIGRLIGIEAERGTGISRLTISLDKEVKYQVFKLTDPLRLVIELLDTVLDLSRRELEVNDGIIKKVRLGQFQEQPRKIVRVVIELSQLTPYVASWKENKIILEIANPTVATAVASEAVIRKVPATPEALLIPKEKEVVTYRMIEVETKEEEGKVRIVIHLDGSVDYKASKLTKPPMVILDLYNTIHAWSKREMEVNLGAVNRIRSSQFQDRPTKIVRIVADLNQMMTYQVIKDKNVIYLDLEKPAKGIEKVEGATPEAMIREEVLPPKKEVPAPPKEIPVPIKEVPPPKEEIPMIATKEAEVRGVEVYKVTQIEVKDTPERTRVIVSADKAVEYKLAKVGDPLLVGLDLINATLDLKIKEPRPGVGLVRQIKAIQLQEQPTKVVRILVELKQQIPSYTTPKSYDPKQVMLELEKPQLAKPISVAPPRARTTGLISLDFKDADINNVLRIIAYEAGVNIVAGEEVKGKVTVSLSDVPWERALGIILETSGFAYLREANIIRVGSAERIKAEKAAREQVEPLLTKIIPLKYAIAKEIKGVLRVSDRGKIDIVERTNSLLVTDTSVNIVHIEEMVKKLDIRTPQVMIEAKIVEISSDKKEALGITWTATSTGVVSSASVNLGVTPPITGSITVGKVIDSTSLSATLDALAQSGEANVLSSPKITVLDNKEATITDTTKIPYITGSDANGNPIYTWAEVMIKLKVTPRINVDNRITMDISPTVGNAIEAAVRGAPPTIITSETTTQVMVKDGQTAVLGGLIRHKSDISRASVPFISKAPIVGGLFRRKTTTSQEKELMVFVTPHIVTE